jgi:hypothetical protein
MVHFRYNRVRSATQQGFIGTALFLAAVGLAFPALGAVDYLRDIKPVLAQRCYACHGALKQKGDLRVDTADKLSAVVVPGKPDASELIARLTATDEHERMPQEAAPLKPEQIAAIREWIASGAPVPKDERGEDDPRDHWSFQRIEKPAVPGPGGAGTNPIDAFFASKHAAHSLKAQPEAERGLLLRRLYLDLVGLPPTLEQLSDPRPYEAIVDELLQSPHHGERWARHWMDVWRYTDWYGLGAQLRNSQKHLWRWRDWIVDSLNEDKGYDRMILEMIAGDEIAPNDPEVIRATGFLARNYYLFNRTTWLDDTIEHTGKAILGLTLNCAKCHDHKYDPIEAVDYYNFRAIFEPHQVRLDPVPGVTDFEMDGLPRVFDDHPEAETFLHKKGDPANLDKEKKITPAVPALLANFAPPIEPVTLPIEAWAPASRDYVKSDRLAEAREKISKAKLDLDAARERLAKAPPKKPEEKKAATATPAGAGEIWLSDSFDKENPERWEIVGPAWKYEGGKVVLTQATRDPVMLRTRQPHPRDFDLTCRYTTTGGDQYKSVTVRFDTSDDGKDANYVYTSAVASGSKLQVAYSRGGQSEYPPSAAVPKVIKVGEAYEMRFAVRDRLINVWLNGEFLVAHRLPSRPENGRISLSGFDATVAFDSIEVKALPADLKLTETTAAQAAPANSKIAAETAPADPAAAVKVAEARVVAAEADLAHLEAVIAADASVLAGQKDDTAAKAASQAEGRAQKARATVDLLTHEAAKDDAKIKAAKDNIAKAEAKIAAQDTKYTALKASKKAFETPAHNDSTYGPTYSKVSTGRRTMLARWMTARENPLTARVMVNHVWLRHFGEPLVETVFDFGRQAKKPEDQEVLDYLAAEFMENGWSFRHLHRLIVTSAAYRRSSSNAGADPATLAADPTNRHYWRAYPRRMESQAVRDSLLTLAGTLDPAVGGPPVAPNTPTMRRSLYFLQSRDDEDRFLSMFDNPDILACYRRSESIVPQQALALANSSVSLQMAEKIAQRLFALHPSEDRTAFVDAAFTAVLGRKPGGDERNACDEFWGEIGGIESVKKSSNPDAAIRSRLVHSLLNHNDFVTVR